LEKNKIFLKTIGLILAIILFLISFAMAGTFYFTFDEPSANNTYFNISQPDFNITIIGQNGSYAVNLIINGTVNMTGDGTVIATNGTTINITTNIALADGVYNWTWNATNGSIGNSSAPKYTFTIDTTYPNVTYNTTSAPNNTNYSRDNFFIAVIYNETNIANTTILVYNATGVINTTVRASSGNTTYNMSGIPDGRYNYNVTVKDLANNKNTTLETRVVTLDTTAPDVTTTVTAEVNEGETVTFSCTSTDVLDGNPSVTQFVKKPDTDVFESISSTLTSYTDTGLAGTHTFRCTSTDNVGNAQTVDKDFLVRATSGGSSSSGGGSGGSSSSSSSSSSDDDSDDSEESSEEDGSSDPAEDEVVEYSMAAEGDMFDFDIETDDGTEEHTLTIIEVDVEAGTVTLEIESEPQRVTLAIGETKTADIDGDGVMDLEVTLNSIDSEGLVDLTMVKLDNTAGTTKAKKGKGSTKAILIIAIVVLLVGLVAYLQQKRK
jgi:hypothetical protein